MSLTSTNLHSSALVRIRQVVCRPCDSACGEVEYSEAHTLVLPLAGVFLKHLGGDARVVGDRQHALFFNAGEPYRVSHPVRGGDESLAVDFSAHALADVLGVPNATATCGGIFPQSHARLEPRVMLVRHLLANRLRANAASELEADETALQLLSACFALAAGAESRDSSRRREHSRQAQKVEDTLLTLSCRPEAQWSLGQLARRVHSSPWHLAHTFRRYVGLSLHQFQLLARLSAALDYLLDSDVALASLAADLGFSSHSHFTSAFHVRFGFTPTELRRDARPSRIGELRRNLIAKPRH